MTSNSWLWGAHILNEQDKITKKIDKIIGDFGVAFDANNNLYIADRGNHRVQTSPRMAIANAVSLYYSSQPSYFYLYQIAYNA